MSDERSRLADRAEALRLAFDRSFAEERRRDTPSNESLLAFDLGAEPYALRLSEIAGIFVDRKITRLPGGATALLGFAGFSARRSCPATARNNHSGWFGRSRPRTAWSGLWCTCLPLSTRS